MAITGNADVQNVIETVVSTMLTQTLIQESVGLGAVRDFSSMVRPGMDQLDIPLMNELAVQDVLETGADMTPQTINPSEASLVFSRHKSIPFSITSAASVESKINLVQEAVRTGTRSLVAEIDDALFAEGVANAGTTNTVAGADSLEDILAAKVQFDADNVLKMDRFIIASPVFMQKLLSTNNVIRANEYGSTNPVQAGMVASIYGMTILESSSASLPADGFLAIQREGLAFARQRSLEFERQRQVLGQRDDYTLTHKYGIKSSVDTSNVRLYVFDPA